MTPEITVTLKRHPIWYGPRPDWVFTFNRTSAAFRYRSRKGVVYELRFGSVTQGIWLGRLEPSKFCLGEFTYRSAAHLIHAKSLHFSDGSKFVFPPQKVTKKVTGKVSK